jgi:hypothetical protein
LPSRLPVLNRLLLARHHCLDGLHSVFLFFVLSAYVKFVQGKERDNRQFQLFSAHILNN